MAGGLGDGKPIFTHSFDMKLDGLAHFGFDFGDGCASGDAAWKVGNISRVVAFCFFNHDCISHMTSLLEARLLQDAALGARSEIVARFARNSDAAGLGCMFELSVATAHDCKIPTILLQ